MLTLIRNPIEISPGRFDGHHESRHRTIEAASAAFHRLNRRCQRANGPNSYLDLRIVDNNKEPVSPVL